MQNKAEQLKEQTGEGEGQVKAAHSFRIHTVTGQSDLKFRIKLARYPF